MTPAPDPMSQNPPQQVSATGVLARIVSTGAFLIVGLWAAFFWMEAEKEIRTLCDTFAPGAPVEAVRATLDTGLYLRSRLVLDDAGDRLVIDSVRNLGQSTCVVQLDGERVLESRYASTFDLSRIAMITAVPLLLGMALLQLTLALGAPFGMLAWGGKHVRLPARLRRRSAVASLVLMAAIVVVLAPIAFLLCISCAVLALSF